jgi:hypothetical protein
MRELALHILDTVENSIEANAYYIDLTVVENMDEDRLQIIVQDDGRAIDAETVKCVRDLLFTTRSTRHVGLGLPTFATAAERCGGELVIEYVPGQGSTITVTLRKSYIDRAPLSGMPSTLLCILLCNERFDLRHIHHIPDKASERTFELDSSQHLRKLGGIMLSQPMIRRWLSEYVAQSERNLKENQCQN